jgi:hypothetical protein
MKEIFKILFVFFLFTQLSYAHDCKAVVKINSDNDDLLIFVDDKYAGNGTVEMNLEKGQHKIKVKEPGIKWDARSIQKVISIDNCEQNYSFTLQLEDEVLLKTNPDDVYVYDKDLFLGNTPLLISRNVETIELEKRDYKLRTLKLSDLPGANPVKLDFTGELKTKSFTETPYFGILIGTAVGLGAIAAYYKIQADQSYDKYEETKEGKYLDDTRHYDNISGIAFGALQINFGTLIYFLLSDQ